MACSLQNGYICIVCVCTLETCYALVFLCVRRPKTMNDEQYQAEVVGLVTPHDQSDPSKDDDAHISQLRQVVTYPALHNLYFWILKIHSLLPITKELFVQIIHYNKSCRGETHVHYCSFNNEIKCRNVLEYFLYNESHCFWETGSEF